MQNNKRIIRVLVLVSFMFLALVSYLLYFNMFQAEKVSSNPYNKRQWEDERYVKRGSVTESCLRKRSLTVTTAREGIPRADYTAI